MLTQLATQYRVCNPVAETTPKQPVARRYFWVWKYDFNVLGSTAVENKLHCRCLRGQHFTVAFVKKKTQNAVWKHNEDEEIWSRVHQPHCSARVEILSSQASLSDFTAEAPALKVTLVKLKTDKIGEKKKAHLHPQTG